MTAAVDEVSSIGIGFRRFHARTVEMLDLSSNRIGPPVGDGSGPRDLLSEILLGLRLDGVEYGRCRMREPWAVAFPAQRSARFHFVATGGSWLRTRTADWVRLAPGDAV